MNALPADIEALIDDERRRLQQAAEVLAALVIAAEYDADSVDVGDVALAGRGMIDQAVAALDPTALRRSARQHSGKEGKDAS